MAKLLTIPLKYLGGNMFKQKDFIGSGIGKMIFMFLVFSSFSVVLASSGSTGMNYLRLGVGARASGMGEAQAGISDGVESIYWNPAGLSLLNRQEVSLMYLSYFQGTSYGAIAYGTPIGNEEVLGIGINYFDSGLMDKTVSNITGSDYSKEGTFNYIGFSGLVSYSRKVEITSDIPINVGGNFKILGDKIEDDTVIGVSIDIGVRYTIIHNLTVGITGSNIGILFGKDIGLPITFRGGVGYRMILLDEHCVTLGLDGSLQSGSGMKGNIGLEYVYDKTIYVRGGYKLNYGLEELTLGLGFRIKRLFDLNEYGLDYSFVPGKEVGIGSEHRISLMIRFGE